MVSSGTTVPGLRIGQTCDITIEDVDGAKLSIAMPTHRGELVIPAMGRMVQISVQASGGGTVFIQAEVTGRQNQPFPILTARILSASQQQARSYFRADVTLWPSECSVWGEPPLHGAHPEHAEQAGHAGQTGPAEHDAHTVHAAHPATHRDGTHAIGTHHVFWRPVRATVHDLSGGGAALLTHEHLRQGERVKLRFPLPHGGGEIAVEGDVRRSISRGRDSGGDVRWDLGIAFEGLKADVRDRLVKAVNRLQAEDRRRQQQA